MKVAAAFLLVCILGSSLAVSAAYAGSNPWWQAEELRLLELYNGARAEYGVVSLKRDNRLSRVAVRRCQEIAISFTHKGWTDAFVAFGVPWYRATIGENLAWWSRLDPEAVFAGWMASPSHRAAILIPLFRYVGFAHCERDGITYWAAEFRSEYARR